MQTRRGVFEKAVITLDGVVRNLAAEGGRTEELARAHLYLAVAYFHLEQEEKARAEFLKALETDTDISITASEFPPRILQFFEETKAQAAAAVAEEPPEATPTVTEPQEKPEAATDEPPTDKATAPDVEAADAAATQPSAMAEPSDKRGGGRKKLLILAGVGAAAGIGVATAKGGGDASRMFEQELIVEGVGGPLDDGESFYLEFPLSGTILEAKLWVGLELVQDWEVYMSLHSGDGLWEDLFLGGICLAGLPAHLVP